MDIGVGKKVGWKKVVIYGEGNFRTVASARISQRVIGNILESLKRRAMERGYDTVRLSTLMPLMPPSIPSTLFHFKVSFSSGGFSKDIALITKDGIKPTSAAYREVRGVSLEKFTSGPVDLGAKKSHPMEKYAL